MLGDMGALETTNLGLQLGDNDRFMAWLKAQAAELAIPRDYSSSADHCPDLRVLFISLMPYEFARFKRDVVKLLSEFSGFRTDTIQAFRTRLLFAKLKIAEMSNGALDELSGFFGIDPEDDKVEQIDKFVNLIARPENTGLSVDKQSLLLKLSRVENMKIPGTRRNLNLPKSSSGYSANTPSRSTQAQKRRPNSDEEEMSDNANESNQDSDSENKPKPNSAQKSMKRARSNSSRKAEEHSDYSPNPPKNRRPRRETDDSRQDLSSTNSKDDSQEALSKTADTSQEEKEKRQLRKSIETYLRRAQEDVTMRMVKEYLRQHFDRETLAAHKAYIKTTVMEVIDKL